MDFRQYEKAIVLGGQEGTVKIIDPVLIVEDFKIIHWKDDNPGDGFDQDELWLDPDPIDPTIGSIFLNSQNHQADKSRSCDTQTDRSNSLIYRRLKPIDPSQKLSVLSYTNPFCRTRRAHKL